MVAAAAKKSQSVCQAGSIDVPKEDLRWCSVSLAEVIEKGKRLDASVFGIDSKNAREVLAQCKWEYIPLVGDNGFSESAFYPGRCKRIYSKTPVNAVGFLGSSEMLDCRPIPSKFLAISQNDTSKFELKKHTILLSRSGTVGNVSYVNSTLVKYLVSEHAIRIVCKKFPGYLYAYLKTKIGRTLVESNIFGSVVDQIEPDHLNNAPIPNPPDLIKRQINKLIVKSFELRDESNDLLDKAERLLYAELNLPPIEQIKPKYFDKKAEVRNYTVKLSSLNNRFDGSYHVPIVDAIIRRLRKTAAEITTVADPRISKDIILPGRFKRVYVEEGQGTVFFGGKQIYELDPSGNKYLSLSKHGDRIKQELTLKENMVLITRSGTIGRTIIVPKHWEQWVANEHIIRILPADKTIAGYLYVFLASDYGWELIGRNTFGSVVDEIDVHSIAYTQFPLLKNLGVQQEINNLALKANTKRTQAYNKEQQAIEKMNETVIYATE